MLAEKNIFIAVGASGHLGLRDICELLHALPGELPAVVMIVLHRPADRLSNLCEILGRASALPVEIAGEHEKLKAGHCYVGEPAAHLTLAANSFGELLLDPTNAYRNRTIDALFKSVAEHAREHFIGVVLSGSLDDGSRGLAAIHAAGGTTMVITPKPPLGANMPESAIHFDGPISFIGTPQHIAAKIVERITAIKELASR